MNSEYVGIWNLSPISAEVVTSEGLDDMAPVNLVSGCRAVGRDLLCRREGRKLDLENYSWRVALLGSGYCHLSLHPGKREKPRDKKVSREFGGVGFGGLHIDQEMYELLYLIAEGVQDNLAGYSAVQWPINEQGILFPKVIEKQAMWVRSSTGEIFCPIGSLCE